MRDYVGEKDGVLYIVSEDTDFAEPILRRLYYPLLGWSKSSAMFFREYGEHKRGQRVTLANRMAYIYRDEDGLQYQLVHGGDTKPVAAEEIPIPRPKVRQGVEVRYAQGQWKKLTKKGWVLA